MISEVRVEVEPGRADLLEEFLAEQGMAEWHLYSEVDEGLVWLTGYFASEENARAAWEELRERRPAGVGFSEPRFREVEDSDWRDSYKEHFHPWSFAGLHWVPVWERESFEAPEGDQVVWLDPGMAFGTGNHETTRLCVERLLECRRDWLAEGRELGATRVLDAGCGSGILAISAAKCGFGPVAGFDLDPVAVEVSGENAELNGLSGRIDFFQGDLVTGLRDRTADLVVANIQADVLCRFSNGLGAAVRPGGRLVLSGILATELEKVETCFKEVLPGATFKSRKLGEWSDLQAVVR